MRKRLSTSVLGFCVAVSVFACDGDDPCRPDDDPGAPHAALTGDTLFIGDVGRPDLAASVGVTADELAGQLYDSLFGKLLKLPDDTLVYPGHGAGSMCGKNLSNERVSTIGSLADLLHIMLVLRDEEVGAAKTCDPRGQAIQQPIGQIQIMTALLQHMRP